MLFEDGGQAPSTPGLAHQNVFDMAQTSINIQPCKLSASERHNKREKALSYVRPELSHLNEWYNTLDVHLKAYDARLRKLIKEKTGRACQAKSHPLHEAVVVIRKDTTMDDIKKLADAMHQRWGFHFVQLAIHKDEGNWKDGVWKSNFHAHMVFDKIDHESGKTIKTTGKDTAEMQDMCARILGMERGKKSDKKHLDALDYKVKVQEERAAQQTKAIALQSILGGLMLHAVTREVQLHEGKLKYAKEQTVQEYKLMAHYRDLRIKVSKEREEISKETQEMRSTLQFERGRVDYRQKQAEALKTEISGLSEQKDEVLKLVEQKEQLKKDVLSLECRQEEAEIQLGELDGKVFIKEKSVSILQGEVQELEQQRDQAKKETAAARTSLQELTRNKEHVKTWKWAYNELLHIIQPVLDAITRLAHYNGRGGMFTAFEAFQINMALGKDDKREERAARYTRWAKEDEEKPQLYGDYRYRCAGEEMQKIAKNPSEYLNRIKEGQSRGMGY